MFTRGLHLLGGRLRRLATPAVVSAATYVGKLTTTTGSESDQAEMKQLLTAAGLPVALYPDFDRNGVGATVELMAFQNSHLLETPPQAAAVRGLITALRTGSTLAAPDALPADNHGDYAGTNLKFTALCGLAQAALPDAKVRRLKESGDLRGQRAPSGRSIVVSSTTP